MPDIILANRGLTKIPNPDIESLLRILRDYFPEAVVIHHMLYFGQRDKFTSIEVFLQDGKTESESDILVIARRDSTEETAAPIVQMFIKPCSKELMDKVFLGS